MELLETLELKDQATNPPRPAYICTFWKGRVALYGVLKALGVKDGDWVLVPGYTCAVVPGAVLYTGARPIYVDIDSETYNITLRTVQEAWAAKRDKRVKALILQHTYGIPAEIPKIVRWAREKGLAVVEDCAHAWGSRYLDGGGQWCEVGVAGDAAIFSSQWSKPISTGLGGWTLIRNRKLADHVLRFRELECAAPSAREVTLLAAQVLIRAVFASPGAYWLATSSFRWLSRWGILIGTTEPMELKAKVPRDYAKRMSSLQEWLLKRRVAKPALQNRRRKLKALYDDLLTSAGLPVLQVPEFADPVLVRYPVRVRNKEELLAEARQRRIELGDWFNQPLHPKEAVAEAFEYRTGICPEAERAAREVVNLPMIGQITESVARRTIALLKEAGRFQR